MTANGWLQILLFLGVVSAVTVPLGRFMARVFTNQRTLLDGLVAPVERLVYRIARVDPTREMRWTEYAAAALLFGLVSMVSVYLLQRVQAWLPLNPQHLPAVPPGLAFNTAASFATNTDWQAYSGETTMSYLTQMAGLAVQNFVSAATGIALGIAFIRGIARVEAGTIGNFWVDVTRAILWILLPFSFVGALVLVSQGVVQNFRAYDAALLVDRHVFATTAGGREAASPPLDRQVIAQGPVASQEAIKEWGTNGGGFFNANSAHPFENPTPLSNFLEMLGIFSLSAGLTATLGEMTGSRRHGWAVWAAMAFLFLAGVTTAYWAEAQGNPLLPQIDQQASQSSPGGNMEGKEVRFGVAGSALFATVTTDASCGAVNAMHDSFTPIGGLVPLANVMLGEVVFGGVGSGLYGILVFIVLAVFIAGLMVGRTPEYLGKRIQSHEVKMAMLAVLVFPLTILALTAVSIASPAFGTSAIANRGPHGLTEILYAFVSGVGNNGSAFAGLGANTRWYNVSLAMAMLIGRFFVIVPTLAIAGSLAGKKRVPVSAGTFPVTTPLFTALLVSVIVIVGALTFFPALSLGPIVEHLLMRQGRTF
ncbi:MAG TPA: potassium-transporting ATPase subunit KdpA [Vicinamibacterales bacterium]|jgi:K+-transporting ATPase ATPase A chain